MQKPIHTLARIIARRIADEGGKYFELLFEVAEAAPYLPGQYLNVVLDGQRRSFSIVNLPEELPRIELLIERIPGGIASRYLAEAPLLSSVEIVYPFGRLVPQAENAEHHILVGTGSGIASLRPIAEWLIRNTNHSIQLLWGLRYRQNLFWQDWLERLQSSRANVSVMVTLTQPDKEWSGFRGRVTEHVGALRLGEKAAVYLCGGKPMLDDMRQLLKAAGVPSAQILTEQFHL
ncbi:MAG: hypothetical protein D6747_04360 [Chlorobiota bacterium]|jgi:CDP-4-dehydro-6-deoxyglucose reductase|nr:MAG: hypothetical protein D6747_04360 [Chlorobiota bacterium]